MVRLNQARRYRVRPEQGSLRCGSDQSDGMCVRAECASLFVDKQGYENLNIDYTYQSTVPK